MKKGISLIVLVITIIVIVIISGSVILSLSNNNPINSAEEATFKSDLEQIQNELALYAMTQFSNPLTLGTYDINTMDGTVGAFSTAGAASKYASILSVTDGKLVIGGAATSKQLAWAGQLNVQGGTIVTDTTKPVITLVGSNPMSVVQNVTYTEPGATCTDDSDSAIQSKLVITGTVNTAVIGSYTRTYNVTDASGNVAITVTRTVNVINPTVNFAYTGASQSYTVPTTGTYKLEVWGAQGGNGTANNDVKYGGKGGYSTGQLTLNAGETIYVYVGGSGLTVASAVSSIIPGGFNGGGSTWTYNTSYTSGSGGGASDIRRNGTALTNRIIVAGGGGGSADGGGSIGSGALIGGTGGGTNGGTPNTSSGSPTFPQGGTQSAGGNGGAWSGHPLGENGSLGQGGNVLGTGGNSNGGGGGGYYGGGGGTWVSGGGGSGYVGSLSNSQTLSGTSTMPAPGGSTQVGQSSHGYAKITFIN